VQEFFPWTEAFDAQFSSIFQFTLLFVESMAENAIHVYMEVLQE